MVGLLGFRNNPLSQPARGLLDDQASMSNPQAIAWLAQQVAGPKGEPSPEATPMQKIRAALAQGQGGILSGSGDGGNDRQPVPFGGQPSNGNIQSPTFNGTGSPGGGLVEGIRDLLDGGKSRARNITVDWLTSKGYEPGAAEFIARDKPTLQAVLRQHVLGTQPDLQMQTIYDDRGRETKVLMDMNTGQYRPMGGAKTNLLSPAEIAQKKDIAAAGRTSVNVGGVEKGYDKTVGEGYGKLFLDMQTEGQIAGRALNSLAVMEQAMNQPGFYSGAGVGPIQYAKRVGAALGLDPDGIESMESFNAMAKSAALDTMGGSLGTGFSNADRDFVLDQVPNLSNTPQGNRELIRIQTALSRRKQEIASLARDYAKQNNGRIDAGFDDYLAQWAERNPLFPGSSITSTPGQRISPEGPSRVNTPSAPGNAGRVRAVNPQTGERIEWNGSTWEPVQ